MNSTNIYSPLSGKDKVKLIKVIDTSKIINEYKTSFNIDVSRFFKNISRVFLYECIETNYKYYFPFDIDGDSLFYQSLQKFSWYYMKWKWEYSALQQIINKDDRILEVGCGYGNFLEAIKEKTTNTLGLEINEAAILQGITKGIRILNINIEQYSSEVNNFYDVVCAFQVVEHITNVKVFLQACIKTLRNGGKLIISVPNDESFLKYSDSVLNGPPHHMGLWNNRSLENLSKVLNLQLLEIKHEPLQKYHYAFYIEVMLKKYNLYNKVFRKVLSFDITRRLIEIILNPFASAITGHSILAIYEKVSE